MPHCKLKSRLKVHILGIPKSDLNVMNVAQYMNIIPEIDTTDD